MTLAGFAYGRFFLNRNARTKHIGGLQDISLPGGLVFFLL